MGGVVPTSHAPFNCQENPALVGMATNEMKSFVAVMVGNNLVMGTAVFTHLESVLKITLLVVSCVYTTLQIVKVYRSLEAQKNEPNVESK